MNNIENEFSNKKIKRLAAIFGITLAISGLHHGFFEILQGNKPTTGLVIQSIGIEYQRWTNGEEAFTIIPNYLITGIVAISVSAAIIVWSLVCLEKPYGHIGFLLLFILLTLVGGGIGHLVFFLPVWGYATRIKKPLKWWKKILPDSLRRILSKLWGVFLFITLLFFIIGLEISVFGIPGITNDDTIFTLCWLFLLGSLVFMNFSFIAGFSYEIENR